MAALIGALRDVRRFLFGSWLRGVFGVWFCALMLAFVKNAINGPVHDKIMGMGVLTCALSTFVFWVFRGTFKRLAHACSWAPALRFVVIGGLGAVWAEFVFWALQTAFHITGVAAHANFGGDLLVTMPWYLMMLALLWPVVTRRAYSLRDVVFMGGLYDMCADGFLRQAIGGALSVNAVLLDVVGLPMFMVAYSLMVLPPCVLLAEEIARVREARPQPRRAPRAGSRLALALLPIAGFIPYTMMLIVAGSSMWK